MEGLEANVEVSEEKILCQLKCTRLEYNELHAPSQGLNMQISMILHQCTFKSAIRLSMVFFKMTTVTV